MMHDGQYFANVLADKDNEAAVQLRCTELCRFHINCTERMSSCFQKSKYKQFLWKWRSSVHNNCTSLIM